MILYNRWNMFFLKNIKVFFLFALIIFSFSFYSFDESHATSNSDGRNWQYLNYDRFGTNYNPQMVVNSKNVNDLAFKWAFFVPEPEEKNLGGYIIDGQHEISSPLIVDGNVYLSTAFGRIYSIDGESGEVLWSTLLDLNRTRDQLENLPIHVGPAITHVHGITFFENKLFVPSPPCDIYILDSITGENLDRIRDSCNIGMELGNYGKYKGPQSYGPTVYEKERILIIAGGAIDETNRGGRGFFAGYDLDTKELLWRRFVVPPAGGDPNWALKHSDVGWIRGIRASELPKSSLIDDWGVAGLRGSQAGPNRGQWVVDESTGIVYVATTHAAPASNATHRPGPNVFSASLLALNSTNGNIVWWHQIVPHDLSDWDCNWNIVLSNATINNSIIKIILKSCKDGSLNAFNAQDGSLVWQFNSPALILCEFCNIIDPADSASLKKKWANYPEKSSFYRNPTSRGGFVSDIALANDKVFVASYNFWDYIAVLPVDIASSEGGKSLPPPKFLEYNTTIYAIDVATGEPVWEYFLPNSGYRTSLVASGDLLYFSSTDGNLYALNADTGMFVWKRHFGIGLLMPPIIGADANGDMMILVSYGGQNTNINLPVPGGIIALHLDSLD